MFMGDLTFIKTIKTITEKIFTVKISVFILKKRRNFSASFQLHFSQDRTGQEIDSMLLFQVALGDNLSPTMKTVILCFNKRRVKF